MEIGAGHRIGNRRVEQLRIRLRVTGLEYSAKKR
jgi:hypothetical protein